MDKKLVQECSNLIGILFNCHSQEEINNIFSYHLACSLYHHYQSPSDCANTLFNLGLAYDNRIEGDKAENLEIAIQCYQLALQEYKRNKYPHDWANTQNNLGHVYYKRITGSKAENLEIAIQYYQQALHEYNNSRHKYPLDWARTQNNLGLAYDNRIEGDKAENLEIAIQCYQLALQEYKRNKYPHDWANTQNNLGHVYYKRITGSKAENLEIAIQYYQQALHEYNNSRHKYPLDWARTQNNLGLAYMYRLKGDKAENLEIAIQCYQQALEERNRDQYPEDWANTQNNLGAVYSRRLNGDKAENLEIAIQYYQQALEEYNYNRHKYPSDWANTQNNLGLAYDNRIEGDKAENLEIAIQCYQLALEERKRDKYPQDWANSQINLGAAYSCRLKGDKAENIEIAIHYHQQALEECKRDKYPLDWARTQYNLGFAYSQRIKGDKAENLELAIQCYQQALEEYRRDKYPLDWANIQNSLGLAYYRTYYTGDYNNIKVREDKAENLELAIQCYQQALKEYRRDKYPQDWANIQYKLGNAYVYRLKEDQAENLELAIQCFQQALEEYRRDKYPQDWARTQYGLGCIYSHHIEGDESENIELAIQYFQQALKERNRDQYPRDWAMTQYNLGHTYYKRIKGDKAENLELAIQCYQQALEERNRDQYPRDWARTQYNLGYVYYHRIKGDKAENLELAIQCYQRALEEGIGNQINLGIAYYKRIKGDKAENLEIAIQCYQRALEEYKLHEDPENWTITQNNLGLAYYKRIRGNKSENIKTAKSYLEAAKTIGFSIVSIMVGSNLGDAAFTDGEWEIAIEGYKQAIEALEVIRTEVISHDNRQEIIGRHLYIYENSIQAAINLKDTTTALEIVERVRAKRLVDLMATADLYQDGNIPPRIKQWLQQLDNLDEQIAYKQKLIPQDECGDITPDELKTRQLRATVNIRPEITELERQKKYILDQLSNNDEVVTKLRQIQPPQLQDFLLLLPDKTTLLNFYTTKNDTHILILHSGETQPHCFTCQGQGYEILQQWMRKTWTDLYSEDKKKNKWTAQMPHTLAEVAQRLEIERLITEHLQDTEELLIVPHLFLHQIPFAALPIAEGYLGDKFLIRYAPSLQVLGFCYNPKRLSAEDGYNYATAENATADLPFSGFEGAKIAEIFAVPQEQRLIREQATRTAYRQLLQQASHIVNSHHAQSRFDNPLESGLKLSDGNISVSQLFSPGWRFPQLQEVFLSCCETGLFLPESITDEPVAVSTGFLCAGASGVIASQWAVYDCSAALLSILYHQQRQQGLNRPRALQAAQRQMRQMTAAEFKKYYQKQLERHIKGEQQLVSKKIESKEQESLNRQLLTKYADAEKTITRYANHKGLPFQHPVHWAAMGCYGLG